MRLLTILALGVFAASAAVAADKCAIEPLKAKPALTELGKRMFHDDRLSGDTSLACANCHQPGPRLH